MRRLKGVVGASAPIFNLMEAKMSNTLKNNLRFEAKVKLFEWIQKGINSEKSSVYALQNNEDLATKAREDLQFDVTGDNIRAMKSRLGVCGKRKKEQPINILPESVKNRFFSITHVCPNCRCSSVQKYGVVDM